MTGQDLAPGTALKNHGLMELTKAEKTVPPRAATEEDSQLPSVSEKMKITRGPHFLRLPVSGRRPVLG